MSRQVRPRIGRTRLQPSSRDSEAPFQVPSNDVAEPMTPVVDLAPSVKAATVADLAPSMDLAALTVSDPRMTAIKVKDARIPLPDQPTSNFPPGLVAGLEARTRTVEKREKWELDIEELVVGKLEEMPVWEQVTAQIPAPRPIPQTSPKTPEITPLEMMLRQLRVRKPKPLSVIRTSSRSALESIWTNRLRSLLTTLSIFIGVAAVIVALILTQGASAYFTDIIAGLGDSSIIIDAGTYSSNGVMARQSIQTLSQLDAITMKDVPHVTSVCPIIYVGSKIVYGRHSLNTDVQAVDTSMLNMRGWELGEGFWFNAVDDGASRQVAVIGSTVASNFYNTWGVDPVGESITINGKPFRIIGVLSSRGGFNLDNVVFIPYHTALNHLNVGAVDRIEVQIDTPFDLDQAQQRITLLLRQHHRLPSGSPNDFQIMSSAQLLQQTGQELQAMTVLLISASAILLTAGGIGIINIMLASVSGRTREIGIRIAVGARRGEIRNQFLIEALLLCLVGGGLGIFAGLFCGFELTKIIGAPFIVTPMTFIMPFAISTFIGVVFGLYPAVKAAQLDPVVALRRSLS